MTRPMFISAAFLASAVLSAVLVADGTVWDVSSGVLFGIGLVLITAVSIVGMVGAAARWAHRMAIATAVVLIGLAITRPLSVATVSALMLGAVGLAGLVGGAMRGLIRQRPAADAPPTDSVILALILLVAPPAWAAASPAGIGRFGWVAAITVWLTMVLYIKTGPFALGTVRLVVPVVLGVCAIAESGIPGLLIGLTAVVAGWYAWRPDTKLAVHPVATPGKPVPIPPELAPRDILDAAGLDDSGRPTGGMP